MADVDGRRSRGTDQPVGAGSGRAPGAGGTARRLLRGEPPDRGGMPLGGGMGGGFGRGGGGRRSRIARLLRWLPEDGSAADRPPLQTVAAIGLAVTALCVLLLVFVAT